MTMKIVFAGTPENAATTLRELLRAGVEVVLAITRPDAPVGRKRVITANPVALAAEELGIPVLKTAKLDADAVAQITSTDATIGVVVAFGVILRANALEALSNGWFNLHYSDLPKWRGAAPVQRSLAAGDRQTAVTLFKLDEGLDSGDVVGKVPVEVGPTENAGELLSRLTGLGVSLLLEQLPRIEAGVATFTPQVHSEATHATKPTRSDARLSPVTEARELENLVRGYTPEPGAWFETNQGPVKVLRAHEYLASSELSAGHITATGGRVLLGCANGTTLELLEVQPAGKNPMNAADWHRGLNSETTVLP
jgi:methionyl-tRNA formyltransferase